MSGFELGRIAKEGGPLTKTIALGRDGVPVSDGSACVMSRGRARRFRFDGARQLADLIYGLTSGEAITLGALRGDLPDEVAIVSRDKMNGAAGVVARTQEYFIFQPGAPALALLDFDRKGTPPAVAARLDELGGLWPGLVSILPDLANASRVLRPSTSAGLYRADTGERLSGSGGAHVYIAVRDGADVDRFLKTLHGRCWLAGLGWMMVGAGGKLLERSIVDRVVGAPERLVFEGQPFLTPPLAQDMESRRPIVVEGEAIDTVAACPPLRIVEEARLRELRAKEAQRLAPERAKARTDFIERQSRRLAERTGMDVHRARGITERQCEGVLLPDLVLPFDDEDLAGKTVADVLADPVRFEGATLADPLEGVEYGRCKARIMRRENGTPWIHSFAHGQTVYELKLDHRAARAALEKASKDETANVFVRLALAGDLGEDEIEELRNLAHERSGIGKRVLDRRLREARARTATAEAQERDRRLAERRDPRPQLPVPARDAEWHVVQDAINDVLAASRVAEPPMRDVEGYLVEVRSRRVPGLHELMRSAANADEDGQTAMLPAPEHLLLTRLGEIETAELIERHIEYVNEKDRSVHLPEAFVRHCVCRSDGALPLVTGVCTLPLVLPNGEILAGPGLVRDLNTVFRVPAELRALLPDPEDWTPPAVARAMRFLTHEWLVDVAADYTGRCVIVALALTVIERQLLPMRPAFWITAGKRGGGKTTTFNMVAAGVLGHSAAAAAWSKNEEERRKALFAYLIEGVPLLVWDNIPRGATISCPSVERSLTAEFYTDRLLGASATKSVFPGTIQGFTGNNAGPGGDLSSRSLRSFLEVDRPDPENRAFMHPDPIAWTRAHHGQILRALYTILLGNPRRAAKWSGAPATRFREWYDLVGSAVEFGSEVVTAEIGGFVADALPQCPPQPISFKDLFTAGEERDEENGGLAELLRLLRAKYREVSFKAADLARYLDPEGGDPPSQDAREMYAILDRAGDQPLRPVTPTTVSWRLKKLADAPMRVGDETLVLRRNDARRNQSDSYCVKKLS
jgi:hypothetical protein